MTDPKNLLVENQITQLMRGIDQQRLLWTSPLAKMIREIEGQQRAFKEPISKMMHEIERQRQALRTPIADLMRGIEQQRQVDSPLSKAMREMEIQQRAIKEPISKMMHEIERQRQALRTPIADLMRGIEQQRQIDSPLSKAIRALEIQQQVLKEPLAELMRGIERQRTALDLAKTTSASWQQQLANIKSVDALLHDGLRVHDAAIGAVETLSKSDPASISNLTSELAEIQEYVSANVTSDEAQNGILEALLRIIGLLEDLIERAEYEIDRRAAFRFALWLLPYIFAIQLSMQSDKELAQESQQTRGAIEQMHDDFRKSRQLEQQFDQKIDRISHLLAEQAKAARGEFYAVKRLVPLCEERRYCDARMAVLPPGTEVEVIERHGKWINIRVRLKSGRHEGWVLKKYLLRIR